MARTGIFFALAMALLMGLWQLLRPIAPPATPAAAASMPAAPSGDVVRLTTAELAGPKRFVLDPDAPTATPLQVQLGDDVELSITMRTDDELHLHGYDLAMPLKADEPGTLRFIAKHAGRFELELHHAHVELGVLEVLPR
jgi:hypothetical protein